MREPASRAAPSDSSDPARPGTANLPPRLVSAGVAASLERFNDPQLLAEGRITLVSVEAVQQRFARRWPLRQEQVYEFTDRVLERGVGASGAFVRISATDYLIIHLDRERLAAQAACLRYLREVLHHFLGESHMADLGVLEVRKIGAGGVEAEVVDAAAADRADREQTRSAAVEGAPDDERTQGPDRWSPFVAGDGRTLRVTAKLEPVYELRRFSRIGMRMVQRVVVVGSEEELPRSTLRNLATADILQADLATMARGLNRLRDAPQGEQQPSLVVPLSYTSLASQRGRTEIVKLMKEAASLLRCGVICEICDIEGVPPGSLLSATSLIRPFTMLVAGRLTDTQRRAAAALRNQGLSAVTLECPTPMTDEDFADWATRVIPAARQAARSVIVYGVESPRRAAQLGLVGASHATVNLG